MDNVYNVTRRRDRYITDPRSRMAIRRLAYTIRQTLQIKRGSPFPVMRFLEYMLPKLYPDIEISIEEPYEMPRGMYAYYDPCTHTLHIDCDVYVRACDGSPRDLFTIAHEISHVLLLENSTIVLARSEEYVAFRDPEWQANELAAELLAPHDEVVDMSESEIVYRYNVSRRVAEIQKSKK